ncbi:uncharacterized protein BDZ99DRAFT_470902 [Mytilinidion resinicola]|uniref:Uncharacterized protein n=1 Tax=Mytilinidion resinicola TaxID=574789 RepID=A0A6A6ZA20_9PEZI|nr:uncharacterized protein BDZ99DRAFT_470902 [Mytilinidion resinicola]KAF2817972.1 hypothetical protein BDZ99DRAFT_470902 [Mytilinidion resinicola]
MSCRIISMSDAQSTPSAPSLLFCTTAAVCTHHVVRGGGEASNDAAVFLCLAMGSNEPDGEGWLNGHQPDCEEPDMVRPSSLLRRLHSRSNVFQTHLWPDERLRRLDLGATSLTYMTDKRLSLFTTTQRLLSTCQACNTNYYLCFRSGEAFGPRRGQHVDPQYSSSSPSLLFRRHKVSPGHGDTVPWYVSVGVTIPSNSKPLQMSPRAAPSSVYSRPWTSSVKPNADGRTYHVYIQYTDTTVLHGEQDLLCTSTCSDESLLGRGDRSRQPLIPHAD